MGLRVAAQWSPTMDTTILVEDHIDAGAELLTRLIDGGFDLLAAFWIKPEGVTYWDLYIVSPTATGGGFGAAFSSVSLTLDQIPGTPIGLSQIRLVDPAKPIAKEAVQLRDRHSRRLPLKLGARQFGGIAIEDGYIYPHRSGTMTQSQILNTVVGLMNCPGSALASGITLLDGTHLQVIPTGIERQPNGNMTVTVIDPTTRISQSIDAGQIKRID